MSDLGVKVVSLFDGISGAKEAIERLGIHASEYYASEIDSFAITISLKNHPDIRRFGDVNNIYFSELKNIDLIIGGSPCQGFSRCGKQRNFKDSRSILFFKFVEAVKVIKPKYFLLENVAMKKEWQNLISEYLGVEPIRINSSLVSAQNRDRLYWCNWKVKQPEDRNTYIKDFWNPSKEHDITDRVLMKKAGTLSYKKTFSNIREVHQKSKCLTAEGQTISNSGATVIFHGGRYYELSPEDCEVLQGYPKGYTESVSKTQRYKMLGNAFNVDTVAHILGSNDDFRKLRAI